MNDKEKYRDERRDRLNRAWVNDGCLGASEEESAIHDELQAGLARTEAKLDDTIERLRRKNDNQQD